MEEIIDRSLEIRNSVRWERFVEGSWPSLISGAKMAGPIWSGSPWEKLEYKRALKSPLRMGMNSEE